MAIASKKGTLAIRSSHRVPVLDQAPLGHLQALVLKVLDDLGDDASGLRALEILRDTTGTFVDPAAVYGAVAKLQQTNEGFDKKGKPEGYLKFVGTRKTDRRGPPIRIYKVTPAGRTALKQTLEHYEAVASFLRS